MHRRALKGYIITTGEFTEPAIKWAAGKPIELIDRIKLAKLLDNYQPSYIEPKQTSFF
jgi:restriction endonuclease Mrr